MGTVRKAIHYLQWPILIGIMAALVLNAFTQAPPKASPPTSDSGLLKSRNDLSSQWVGPVSYASAVDRASDSVVSIYTRKQVRRRHPFFESKRIREVLSNKTLPLGSGVIASEDGYILTNHHVVNGADEIIVALKDGRSTNATLVGVNRESDLAVLYIPLRNLNPITIGYPEEARVGDVVLAIGNPFGVGQTVTQGIISATRRRGLHIAEFENFLQTDAAINPGNSGGALIDAHGNLIGINTANLQQSGYTGGIGFAIPADTAMQTLRDIVEFGWVVRGYLGIDANPLTPYTASQLNLLSSNGVIVTDVTPDSPADLAGIMVGDVIVKINDHLVTDGRWGRQKIAESRPGDIVKIEVIRQQESHIFEAVLETRPPIG